MIRVLIVSDRWLVRSGLRQMLEGSTEVEVVGEASEAAEASGLMEKNAPSVVLVDFAMPLQDQIDATSALVRQAGPGRVLVLGGFGDRQHAQRAIEAGASGFLWKGAELGELLLAIQTLHAGTTYLSSQLAPVVPTARTLNEDPLGSLSKRELEVLCFLAGGMTNREIAQQLFVTRRTVETHLTHVFEKLGLDSRTEIETALSPPTS